MMTANSLLWQLFRLMAAGRRYCLREWCRTPYCDFSRNQSFCSSHATGNCSRRTSRVTASPCRPIQDRLDDFRREQRQIAFTPLARAEILQRRVHAGVEHLPPPKRQRQRLDHGIVVVAAPMANASMPAMRHMRTWRVPRVLPCGPKPLCGRPNTPRLRLELAWCRRGPGPFGIGPPTTFTPSQPAFADVRKGLGARLRGRRSTAAHVEITTPDGTVDAYFVHPASGKAPGVIMWPDIFGLRPAFREMADRLAAEGYAVLVPNPFYRDVKGTVVDEDEELFAAVERLLPYSGISRPRRSSPTRRRSPAGSTARRRWTRARRSASWASA